MKALFIAALLLSGTVSAQMVAVEPSPLAELKVMNNRNLSAVPKYGKLELGVSLPWKVEMGVKKFLTNAEAPSAAKINPFLEWNLDVEAVFTHTATGTTQQIEGFYYRDYVRDTIANTWKERPTGFPMRIRFAPPLTGEWTCSVTLNAKGETFDVPSTITFTVVDSDNPGYVKVHPNKRNFVLNDSIIYPVGVNFACPIKGVPTYHTPPSPNDPWLFQPSETHKATTPKQWLVYQNDVRHYHELGGTYIRTLQSAWSTLLEFEKKGNYYDRQPYAWEQDQLLEYCEQNGMYIHFNLLQQEPMMIFANYSLFDWDWSHYNSDGSYSDSDLFPAYCYADGKRKQPWQMFTEEQDLRYHEQRTRYYIARYGYSTSIYLFEILSEPWHLNETSGVPEPFTLDTELGNTVRKAVQTYHERMAKYMRHTLKTPQLIGVDIYTAKFYENELFTDKSIYCPDIDVVSFNPYASSPEKLVITKSGDHNTVEPGENSMYKLVSTLGEKCGKPVMIAEGGAGDGVDYCSNFSQQYLDMMTFGFTGLAGYNSWLGAYDGHEKLLPPMVSAETFMNSDIVRETLGAGAGNWVQGRQAEKQFGRQSRRVKELQYYIAEDGRHAVGYVKNRSYNSYTKRALPECASPQYAIDSPLDTLTDVAWSDGNAVLYVEGLNNRKNYTVQWLDFKTGELILTECRKVRGGKLKLHFPDLTVTPGKPERPALWFTMVEGPCE